MIQMRTPLTHALILTARSESGHRRNALLLSTEIGDMTAIKSGFGTGGTGSRCLSQALALLGAHKVVVDEVEVDDGVIDRVDESALTQDDVTNLERARRIRPSRWHDYVDDLEHEAAKNGTLWGQVMPELLPYALIDPRLMDLALTFWSDPDAALARGYRRLEDSIRARSGLKASSTKLFSDAFAEPKGALTWDASDGGERTGRAQLFAAAYMAFRNPRAHREKLEVNAALEFLLLNQLFRLEAELITRPAGT